MSQSRKVFRVFNTSGTWTAPAGVKNVRLYLRPGAGGGASGGGGGGGFSGNPGCGGSGGGSGGSGGAASGIYLPATVVPGTTYTVTIGAGGIGGAASSGGEQIQWYGW